MFFLHGWLRQVGGCLIRRLEDALDSRTAELIALRKAAVEHAAASPIKSAPLQSALGAWASGPSPLGCAHITCAHTFDL